MWSVIKHLSNAIIPVIQTCCKVTAFDLYDKEARALMNGQSLEVWNNGKLVSRCQYEEIENAHG
jgi:hypothetical protein